MKKQMAKVVKNNSIFHVKQGDKILRSFVFEFEAQAYAEWINGGKKIID